VDTGRILTAFGHKVSRNALVCVAHAGAGARPFSTWGEPLSDIATVLAVRMPGRESRMLEPPLSDVNQIADELVAALQSIDSENIAFFGHCSGAVIAYECAYQAMSRRVKNLRALVVSSQAAPGTPESPPIRVPQQLSELADHLRTMGGMDESLLNNSDFLELVGPAVISDLSAVASYRRPEDRPPLNIPILAISGIDDSVAPQDLASWQGLTREKVDIQILEGDHFYLPGIPAMLKDRFREIFE
jgi:medium-chain acyl-[acyl-carrier-protein] hydrolase